MFTGLRNVVFAGLFLATCDAAHATSYTWAGGANTWSTAAAWTANSGSPTSTDTATFNGTGTSSATINFSNSQAVSGITVTGAQTGTTTFAQTAGSANLNLSIGTGGISIATGAGAVTIGSTTANDGINVLLTGTQSWTNNSGSTLTVDNTVQDATGSSNPYTLTLAGSGNTTFASGSAIIDSGTTGGKTALTVNTTGSGVVTLAGANTFSGATTLTTGELVYNGTSSMSANSAISMASGTTIALRSDTSGTFTSSGVITTSGNTTVNFDVNNQTTATGQTLSLNGLYFSANTTDTVNVTGGNGYTLGLGAINTSSGNGVPTQLTINATTAAASITSLQTNSYGTNLILSGGNTITLGTMNLYSNSTDTLTISGANVISTGTTTSSGSRGGGNFGVVLSSGTLNLSNTGLFASVPGGAPTLAINGGTLVNGTGASTSLGAATTLGGSFAFGTSTGTSANNFTLSNLNNVTPSALTITLNGADTLSLTGGFTNGYAGNQSITVNNGTGTTSATALTIGTLYLSNSATSYTETINGTGNVNITGNISNGGTATNSALIYSGSGILTLSGSGNSYGGGTTVNSGTVDLAYGGGTGAIRGTLTIGSGATVNTTASDALGYGTGTSVTQINVNGGTLNNSTSGNEGYIANLALTGGTTSSTGGGAFNFTAGVGISSLASGTTSVISAPIDIRSTNSASPLTFTTAAGSTSSGIDLLVSGVIGDLNGGTSGILKNGSGTLALTGANTYYGGTTISAGVLQIGNGGTTGNTGTGGIVDNASLVYDVNTTAVTDSNTISGTGSVTQNGTNKLSLTSTTGSYTGGTTINSGAILIGTGNTVPANNTAFTTLGTGTVTINGGMLELGNVSSTTNSYYLGSATVGSGNAINLNGGAVASYDGINSTTGVLNVTAASTIEATYNDSGKGFYIEGNTTGSGNLTLQYSGLDIGTNSFDGSTVHFNNTGTASANSYSGTITVTPATSGNGNGGSYLSIDGANALANATINLSGNNSGSTDVHGAGTLLFGSATTVNVGELTGSGSAVLQLSTTALPTGSAVTLAIGEATSNSYAYSGILSGSGGLTKQGTDTLTLSGANSYTGTTTVSGGKLAISGSGALGTGAALALSGGTLDLGGTTGVTVGAVSITTAAASGNTIQNGSLTGTSYAASNSTGNAIVTAALLADGTAGLTDSGSGTLTLAGADTYTGATSVASGSTLQLQNFSAIQDSVLGMNGTSTLQLRSDSTGTFTTGGTTVLPSGSNITFDVGHLSTGSNNTLTLGGAITMSGTSQINVTGANGDSLALGAITAGTGTQTIDATTAGVSIASYTGNSGGNTLNLIGGGNISFGTSSTAAGTTTITPSGNGNLAVNVNGAIVTIYGTFATTVGSNGARSLALTSGQLNVDSVNALPSLAYNGTTHEPFTISGGLLDNTTGSAITESSSPAINITNSFAFGGSTNSASLNLAASSATISGNSTITVNANTLTLGNTAIGGNVLTKAGSGTLTLGNITFSGAGNAIVNTGSTVLALGTITNSSGYSIDFTPGTGGITTTSTNGNPTTLNLFISTFDTINNGADFAAVNGSGQIVARNTLAAETAFTGSNGNTNTGTNTSTVYTLAGSATTTTYQNLASLIIKDTGTSDSLSIGASNLVLGNAGNGGILYNGGANGQYTISSSGGLLTGGTGHSFNINTYAGTLTISAQIIDGSGNTYDVLQKGGTGTLVLTGANSYGGANGGTTIGGGTLDLGNGNTGSFTGNGSTSNGITLAAGATLGIGLANNSTISAAINNSGAIVGIESAGVTNTLSGVIDPNANTTGGFTQTGAGTTILSAANYLTGATLINAGAVEITNAQALGTSSHGTSGVTVASGGALQISGGITTSAAYALTLNGAGNTNSGGSTAHGALESISGANSYTGAITLASAASIGADAGSLTLPGTVNNGGNMLTVTGAGNTTFSNVISGAGGLTSTATGTVALTGTAANSYTGETIVSAGELDLNMTAGVIAIAGNGADNVVSSPDILVNGGTLKFLAANQLPTTGAEDTISLSSGAVNLNGYNQTVYAFLNSGGTFTTGAAHLTGTGATTTFAGGTNTINSGGIVEDSHFVISGGTNTVQAGGILEFDPNGAGIQFSNGANLTLNSDNSTPGELLLSTVPGSFSITSSAASTTATISSGTGGTKAGVIYLSSNELDFTVAAGTVPSGGPDMSVGAVIADGSGGGGGIVTLSGTGALQLTAANTYTGETLVYGGNLEIGNGTSGSINDSTDVSVSSGGTLSLDQATGTSFTLPVENYGAVVGAEGSGITNTMSGIISGSGGTFTQSGLGTTILTRANTYTGATTVAAGNLELTGSIASGSAVTVGNNTAVATLSGTGTVNGSLTLATTGTNIANLAPGVNTSGHFGVAGTLTVKGAMSIGTGSALDIDLSSTATTVGGGVNDLISMTGGSGSLTFGSSLTINYNILGGTSPLTTGTYTLINGITGTPALPTFTSTGIGSLTAVYTLTGGALDVSFSSFTNGQYTLTTTPSTLIAHAGGGTVTLSTTIKNTGTGTQDSLNYSVLTATAGSGSVSSGTNTSGSALAQNTTGPTNTQTFTAGSAGSVTIGNSATVSNAYGVSGTPAATNVGATINVYSGQSTWNTNGNGSWGTLTGTSTEAFGANWGANQGSPGLDPNFKGVDTATFGAQTASAITVGLNAAAPNLNSITFSSPSTRYTIAQTNANGSGSNSITLSGTTPSINVTNTSSVATASTQTISAPIVLGANTTLNVDSQTISGSKVSQTLAISGPISGSYGLINAGPGTTILSSSTGNTYGGGTTISGGKFYVNSGVSGTSSGTGSGAVTVNGGTLAGSGNITGTSVTINTGGTLASGDIQSATAVDGTHLTITNTSVSVASANLTFDLGANNVGGNAGSYHSFASPNTNTTYLSLSGSTVINFSGTDSVSLVDLTNTTGSNGSLALRLGTPYLLISAGSNADYQNLVINSGTPANPIYSLSQNDGGASPVNGYVVGVYTGSGPVNATDSTTISIAQYGADGVTALTVGANGIYSAPVLYLDAGQLEVVPEPGTWALMLGGVALLVFIQRRRNKAD